MREGGETKRLLFLVPFCSQTEHLEFLFEKIRKQIDCKGSRVFGRSLREPSLSYSPSIVLSPQYHAVYEDYTAYNMRLNLIFSAFCSYFI